MPSRLVRTVVLLAFSLLVAAREGVRRQVSTWSTSTLDDWVSSGNYLIYSCASQAPVVQNLLDLTYLYLQTALLSTDGPAYRAFFRSTDPAAISTVLHAIAAGTNISTIWDGSKRPTLVCANAADPGILDLRNQCQYSPEVVLIQPFETSVVFLCPVFFQRPLSPSRDDCANVNYADTQLVSRDVGATQYGFLVHALADMYIRQTMHSRAALQGDVTGENACLALPPAQAVRNPSSYAFFVSST